jgi:hypothetical protein
MRKKTEVKNNKVNLTRIHQVKNKITKNKKIIIVTKNNNTNNELLLIILIIDNK